jgi:hypothetical protein
MFDRNSMLLAAAASTIGIIVGVVVMNSTLQADTQPFPDPGKIAEAAQAERDVMDFTMPDLSEPQTGEKMSRHGCVMPALPEWAANAPRGEAERILLLKDLYNIGRQKKIIETNACPCEIEYPSWDEAEQKYQELTSNMDRAAISERAGLVGREAGKTLKESLDTCKAWRGR